MFLRLDASNFEYLSYLIYTTLLIQLLLPELQKKREVIILVYSQMAITGKKTVTNDH